MSADSPATDPQLRRLRLLVVDDDEVDRLAIRRSLDRSGLNATLTEAASVADPAAEIGRHAYDCVLLDYHMPGSDAVIQLQRFREASPDVPIVVLTGRGDEAVAVEVMKAGAADYLPKGSLTPDRLAASIRYALEISRAAVARRHAEAALREQESRFRTLANTIPQLAWMATPEGDIYWYNDRWYGYTGTTPEQMQGSGWQSVHHPDHVGRVVASLRESVRTGAPWEDTFPLRGADGEYRWFLSRALPMRRGDGTIAGWFGTNTDISAQKHAEFEREELLARERSARADAERATKAREEVLAILAHDLRNPLHTILGAATLLGVTDDPERRQRQLAIIVRATQGMERLMTDLLDMARIESGSFAIRREAVDLRSLLQEAVDLFEPQAQGRRILLRVDADEDLPIVSADRGRLLQLLSNLLGNALKFTGDGGRVSLRAARAGDAILVSVADSGPGIPERDLPRIFDRFWQAGGGSQGGAGLGLAICKGIVEAHGGRIWAASQPGQGATFHFEIPLVAAAAT